MAEHPWTSLDVLRVQVKREGLLSHAPAVILDQRRNLGFLGARELFELDPTPSCSNAVLSASFDFTIGNGLAGQCFYIVSSIGEDDVEFKGAVWHLGASDVGERKPPAADVDDFGDLWRMGSVVGQRFSLDCKSFLLSSFSQCISRNQTTLFMQKRRIIPKGSKSVVREPAKSMQGSEDVFPGG